MYKYEIADALAEVRMEISRINRAAGETIFNPAATQALDAVLDDMGVA